MLEDGARIQLDLSEALNVDKILLGSQPLAFERDSGAVFVGFPETLRKGRVYDIDFYYSGNPPETGRNLTPLFDQYLRQASLPTLDLAFQDGGQVAYRWNAAEKGFAMPIKVGQKGRWQLLRPTADWQVMTTTLSKDEFEVATDLYYVNVSRQ